MPEPLTTGVLVYLAAEKFIEATAEDLAKRFTPTAIAKISELWKKIKTRLTGRSPKVDEALVKVEEGDSKAIETITKHLDVVLDEDPDFAQELKILAQTIQAGKIQDKSNMTQINKDNATGYQIKAEGGTQYIGNIHINQGQESEKKI